MPLPVFANTILPSRFFPVKSDCPESVGFPFPGGACRIRLEVLLLCSAKEVSIWNMALDGFREISDRTLLPS